MRKITTALKLAIGATIFLMAASFALPINASAISLKQNSVIEGNTILLSDVFHGLTKDNDKVLGPAPLPGSDMVLNARTLLRIAVALDMDWRPSSNADYVVLSRAGNIVESDAVEAALKESIAAEGVPGKFSLSFAGTLPQVILPPDVAPGVEVASLTVKPEKNWFEATIAAPSKANPVQSFKVSGTMNAMTEIPVLSEALGKDAIIGSQDIHMIEIRQDAVKDGMIVNADQLIGMTPRRMITAGHPVSSIDIAAPRSVERGDLVTMVFREGPLVLTAQGKAMQHGATGETIRVVNTSSNKTIEAVVTASKEVTVKSF